jgi:uncharacterized membrane protein YbaN (DUF454 family)
MMALPRLLWTVFGWVALVLGIIGVLLPVMPTTPFILLAAFAFGRGSPAMRRRLEQNRHFGPAIRDWESNGAIRPRHKVLACTLMACSLVGAAILGLGVAVLAIQGVVMGAVAVFILTRPNGAA